ncbi:DNA gyrase subunit A,DNA topoisomerase IV subunit A,Type IIA topoisomerase (DNA gyrase/topo II, topoisomerase IV), A subunit,DNA gyrase, A subunit,DNA gyrase/topoisomerase IV, subunit A [Chlamydia serpentis]|uniref:DNA gyrase subunit A,DNA topoisomerase IV subunit A,Type IIA topoisomerase (DNA gyrase/topo II, topoisomerase IV), A subunit,DNA gyrase, A subunit,DNA gyrase/topoisomerase IV, subunit A n=1 Tax=Chlamydia serpentis TaxID=1967782 RepID=A0A2R8FBN7_9CHLA|nr:DNA gyrase subunit A [Chlamydia serpentis]SPN73834.1 DNA gyrase subunit A,DNA topoisomerase IV subunit A,Type IIA topoisomerase (DNA gyrase/topo II, topoisomerase IV), A subunit,DNA gyrase, A subunit,DNA gyrase/topoisomerase IV, subunit A [Chlamydia serpentis]
MRDVSDLFRTHFMHYASYVILERAIPHILDGLKPVQRRLLWTLFLMDDRKMHKVANIAGRTMALHPHGDAPIIEALVILANKGYLIDTQGNFGNPLTGDPHAAARYIEARLSPLARETLFNTDLISFHDSYDGREKEPDILPAKIPLLLIHGVDGIAVGMTTKIFPHNFAELLKAQIAILNNKNVSLVPDFPSGGIMDASNYQDGLGTITIQASIDIINDRTLIIKQICPQSTTETLIRSIENAAKRGTIKIDTIQDFSTDVPHIEIKLPKGFRAKDVIPTLFEHTECQAVLYSKPTVIYNNKPVECSISEVLKLHTEALQGYLKKELLLLQEQLALDHHHKTLEYIFIKHKLYDSIRESLAKNKKVSADDLHQAVLKALTPWITHLATPPTKEDTSQLAGLTIKKILCFNEETCTKELLALEKKQSVVKKDLGRIKEVTIKYLKGLLERYGHLGERKTQITNFKAKNMPTLKQQSLI